MTFKMDRSGETSESLTQVAGDVSDSRKVDRSPEDASHMIRERNLLLLSVLYYLYGEDWEREGKSPNWETVAATIRDKGIPNYGDELTPRECEQRYKSLMQNGYEVGVGDVTAVLKPPKRLTEAEKRLWILASTSTDIVRTSKLFDQQIRSLYKEELAKIEKLETGDYTMDPSELDLDDDIVPLEGEDEFKFDSLELEKFACDAVQSEVMEKIVGMQDVLVLVKYCYDAVEHAVKKHESLVSCGKESTEESAIASSSAGDCTLTDVQSIVSNPEVSKELTNFIQAAIDKASDEEHVRSTSTATAPTLSKLLDMGVSPPGQPLPDISPKKDIPTAPKATKTSTRASSRDRTPPESASKDDPVTSPNKQRENESATQSVPRSSTSETNGTEHSEKDNKGLSARDSITADLGDVEKKEFVAVEVKVEKIETENKDQAQLEAAVKNIEFIQMGDSSKTISAIMDVSQSSTIEITLDEPEGVAKSRKITTPKKSSTSTPLGTSPTSSRTSSRLASPEPDGASSETEKQKKSLSRQTSGSDGTPTPSLRSRRGATPTKAGSVEKETAKDSNAVNNSQTAQRDEGEDEDAFETPRSTPESPEIKSDIDSNIENRPKQPKVYSAKPPSPLSQVDPKLFEEYNDEEDEELIAIDNSVNKSKNEKTSPAKTYSRRGRTVSSENASENNDENNQNKRSTRKHAPDETDEAGEASGNNDDGSPSKRLTRSSLKLHDAANDEGDSITHPESEKAASESSFNGKEKRSRASKTQMRGRRLFDEKQRASGDGESDETVEGKRLTRARAKTGTTQHEKRSKSSSVGDGDGLSESEPTPTRATRSRASTVSNVPAHEATTSQTAPSDDDELKAFRKNTFNLLEKIISHESSTAIQKYFHEDPSKIIKNQVDFQSIKQKLESGKIKTLPSLQKDLSLLVLNTLLAHPNSSAAKEAALNFHKWLKTCSEDSKGSRSSSANKADNSDVESLESHDDARSETTSKPAASAGGRRKRKRSASETSEEFSEKRRVTRTSLSSSFQQQSRKPKHPISPDIVSANRLRH